VKYFPHGILLNHKNVKISGNSRPIWLIILLLALFFLKPLAKRADCLPARKGGNYELKAVYTIAILDFVFGEDKSEPNTYRYDIKLADIETKKVFYDKLTFIYLEMPKFNKTIEELETRFDKWLFVLRNLNKLDRVPEKLREQIFDKLFETAEIAKFTPAQIQSYEDSLKYYRDLKNSLDTAKEEGKLEVAKEMLKNDEPLEKIIKYTGLTKEHIEQIKSKEGY